MAEPAKPARPAKPRKRLPTIKERELGNLLRDSREAKNLRGIDVAAFLEVDPSTITKWEKADRRPRPADLIALSHLYGWSVERTDELKAMAKAAETSGFWQSTNLEDETRSYLSLEASASVIWNFENAVVPGILQARGYATAVVESVRPHFSAAAIKSNVDARLQRSQVLEGKKPASLHAIVDESVLYREFGGRQAMRDQLRALLRFSEYPNVEIQILRFSAEPSQAQDGPFSLLDFDLRIPIYAYMEGRLGQIFQDEPAEVTRCQESFARVTALAEGVEQSAEIIRDRLEEITESQ